MIWYKLLISFIASSICLYFHLLCFQEISKEKLLENKKFIILFLAFSILLFLVNSYANTTFNTLISFILILLLYQFAFNLFFSKTLYYAFVIWIFGMFLDLFVSCFLIFLNIKKLNDFSNALFLKIFVSMLIPVIIYHLFSIKKISIIINRLYEKIKISKINNYFIIIMLIICVNFLAVINTFIVNENILKYLIIIVLLIFCIMLFIIITINYKKNEIKIENSCLKENNDKFLKIYKEYRLLRHNLINSLIGIETVSNKRSKELIKSLISQYQKENKFIEVIDSIPYGINGIIYQKIFPYANDNINFLINNNISEKTFQQLKPKRYNLLCESIGIALDNALEALKESKIKILYIDINQFFNKIEIQIVNTFQNDIDLDKLGKENYSTKNRGSGLGLNYLLNNKELEFKATIVNNIFTIKFDI